MHTRHPNLILYVTGNTVMGKQADDLVDAVRFGMDYAYARATFGVGGRELANLTSPLSPIDSSTGIAWKLSRHRVWLARDKTGTSPLSDVDGCFDVGPSPYFPGMFSSPASPDFSSKLRAAVELSDVPGRADVNAWDAQGETALFGVVRTCDLGTCAALILAEADPNCRARDSRCLADRVEDLITRGSEHPPDRLRALHGLLALCGGLTVVPEEDALVALALVPEPHRRGLAARLGLVTAPDLLLDGRHQASAAAWFVGPLVLFAPQVLAHARSCGADWEAVLERLRRSAWHSRRARVKALRELMRRWHPDKHIGDGAGHAARVFCYVQALRPWLLGGSKA